MPTEIVKVTMEEKLKALKQVVEKHGELTADLVIKEANPRNRRGVAHALASLIEWDDAKAAHQHRVYLARQIIAGVRPVLIERGVLQPIRAPHYVRDPEKSAREQGYRELLAVKTREEAIADVMATEIGRAASALERALSIALELEREEDAGRIRSALTALEPFRD